MSGRKAGLLLGGGVGFSLGLRFGLLLQYFQLGQGGTGNSTANGLEPEKANKSIKVDQVRELVDFVVQTAQLGGRKVILLEPAEAMNINAANALLKSLEEPSGDTVLLLISHQPSRLLPTIKSRCVQQACPFPSEAQSLAWLAQALPEVSDEQRGELLALAAGSPLMARRLHAQGVLEQRALVVEGVKKLLKQQVSPSQLAESWNALPLNLLFDWFCDWAQLMLRYQLTQDEEGLGQADMRKVVQYLAQKSRQAKVLDGESKFAVVFAAIGVHHHRAEGRVELADQCRRQHVHLGEFMDP